MSKAKTYNGKTLKELEAETGISRLTLYSRLERSGWDYEKAVSTPVNKEKNKETCEQCGKEFAAKKCWERKYCGRDCYAKARTGTHREDTKVLSLECSRCGEDFQRIVSNVKDDTKNHYCSLDCKHGERVEKECEECGKVMSVKRCRKDRKRFCSRSCMGKNTPLAKGEIERNTEAWNKGKELHYNVWNKGKEYPALQGENNPNWKGGKTDLSQTIRTDAKYKRWRSAVYKRDNYTCQECGEKSGDLNADHIFPLAMIIDQEGVTKENYHDCERLWDTENGRTLCRGCHEQTDTWGVNYIRWEKEYKETVTT